MSMKRAHLISNVKMHLEDMIMKAKYYKRVGGPGHYKYFYTEAGYKKAVAGAKLPTKKEIGAAVKKEAGEKKEKKVINYDDLRVSNPMRIKFVNTHTDQQVVNAIIDAKKIKVDIKKVMLDQYSAKHRPVLERMIEEKNKGGK